MSSLITTSGFIWIWKGFTDCFKLVDLLGFEVVLDLQILYKIQ